MFLQGSSGTGKTHTVRVFPSELQRRHIYCLVSATIGIAAVQYSRGQTVHSFFSFGIDERQNTSFASHIRRGTTRTAYLPLARLLVIDEVSMLTPWTAPRVSLALEWIANRNDRAGISGSGGGRGGRGDSSCFWGTFCSSLLLCWIWQYPWLDASLCEFLVGDIFISLYYGNSGDVKIHDAQTFWASFWSGKWMR
jgi:hypothetical protein